MTKATIDTEIDANLPTNNTNAITAAIVRGVLHDMNGDVLHGELRQTVSYLPVYDLASNVIAAAIYMPLDNSSHVVAAGKQFNHIAMRQSNGGYSQFTIGASALAEGLTVFMESLSGSDSTSNLYGVISSVQNDGPGTVKSFHSAAFASGTSSGITTAGSFGLTPVATSNIGSVAVQAQLVSNTGIHDIGTAISVGSDGDRLLYGVGNAVAAVAIGNAFYHAWMATGSSANARAFKVAQNDGTEIQYIKKTGEVVSSTGLIAGLESNGITITAGAATRNHPNGSFIIAAGSSTANTINFRTNSVDRIVASDSAVNLMSGTATPAGGATGTGVTIGTTSNFGIFYGSGVPTLSAAQGSIYLRSDGSSTSTRLYVNTTGATTWTNVTTAA